jgi:putative DNA primase/helicase
MDLKKASAIEIADNIISEAPPIVCCGEAYYIFTGKSYELFTEKLMKRLAHDYFFKNDPSSWSPTKAQSVVTALQFNPRVALVEEMDAYEDYINLNNGVFQFSTKTLHPHSPDFHFTYVVQVDYDPAAQNAPTFMSFLDSVFTEDDGSPDCHTIDNIIQLGGYLIYPQIKMEKMFIFYGTGANGKSLLIDYVFKKFFHKSFLSSLSLNQLSNENSTSRKQLLRSRVNFCTEVKSSDAIESEELKKVITGEDISIERKYDDTIMHQPKCKLVAAGNRFMRFKDTSEGTRRRLMIFNFRNRFETSKKKFSLIRNAARKRIFMAKNKDEMVAGLQAELPAILNIFLGGLERLRDNNWRFEESPNNENVFKEYIEESDYLGTWLETHLEEDDEGMLRAKDILDAYRSWWSYNFPEKKFDISTKLLGRRLKDLFRLDVQSMNIIIDGKKTTTSIYKLKFLENEIWQILDTVTSSGNQSTTQDQLL